MAERLAFEARRKRVPPGFDPTAPRPPEFPEQAGFVDGCSAQEAAAKLLLSLHESGALRALTGLAGKLGPVTDIVLTEANTEPGRNLIGSLLFAGQILAKMPAGELATAAKGLERGLVRARQAARRPPPGSVALARLMMQEDTRRAIHALLLLLNSLGGAMGAKE
ncbi:MAG TPA: hypothetical protein VHC86_14745 [Opitutaceae bacterium]|nr:hypothetical protein [Opitutaceae bacterium]